MKRSNRALALLTALLLTASLAGCQNTGGSPADPAPDVEEPVIEGPADDPADDPGWEMPTEAPVELSAASVSSQTVDAILSSFSAREFTDDPVPDADLETILQCGLKAASARNLQPWRFTVASGELLEGMPYASTAGTVAIIISGAAEEQEGVDVSFDCGLATSNLYNAAQSLGYGAHIYMSGVDSIASGRDRYGIPEGFDPLMVVLIGHVPPGTDAVSSASVRMTREEAVNYAQ